MSNVHRLDPYKVGRIESLGMSNDTEAKSILEKVALQVQPIMRRRQFTVPVLKEFFPSQTNLLGINVGGGGGNTQEICLRLRPASRPTSFMHYESILATMLHELSHNIHGPHAAPFYKLLDELTSECEELMAKGIAGTGAGFDAPSAGKVGGRFIGRGDQLSTFDRRDMALKAAEQRAKRQALMPNGPRKIGGDATGLRDLPPALAAAAAAERRALDNKWCPTEKLSQDIEDGSSIHAALQAVLDGRLNGIPPPPSSNPTTSLEKNRNAASSSKNSQLRQPPPPPRAPPIATAPIHIIFSNDIIDLTDDPSPTKYSIPDNDNRTTPSVSTSTEWECPNCTFINIKPLALQCDVCGGVRPNLENTASPPINLD